MPTGCLPRQPSRCNRGPSGVRHTQRMRLQTATKTWRTERKAVEGSGGRFKRFRRFQRFWGVSGAFLWYFPHLGTGVARHGGGGPERPGLDCLVHRAGQALRRARRRRRAWRGARETACEWSGQGWSPLHCGRACAREEKDSGMQPLVNYCHPRCVRVETPGEGETPGEVRAGGRGAADTAAPAASSAHPSGGCGRPAQSR